MQDNLVPKTDSWGWGSALIQGFFLIYFSYQNKLLKHPILLKHWVDTWDIIIHTFIGTKFAWKLGFLDVSISQCTPT
jgi:hypothetical protein